MKELKFNKTPMIILLVMCAIFLIAGIVFALLPEETYISWGDYDSASTRYYPLIIFGIIDVILLLVVWVTTVSQKKKIERVNSIAQGIGSDAIILNGSIVDREASRKNATKTTLSVVGAILSTLFLGIGFYKVYGNNNARYFILHGEGLQILNMLDKSQVALNKTNVSDIAITDKRNALQVEIMPAHITFSISTRGLEVSVEELKAKLKEALSNSTANPF